MKRHFILPEEMKVDEPVNIPQHKNILKCSTVEHLTRNIFHSGAGGTHQRCYKH